MNFQAVTYDMCRHYVRDQEGLIDAKHLDKVLGWIRSRDLTRLSACGDYIPDALSDRDLCRFTRQVSAFFKKNAAFANDDECLAAAQSSFERAEKLCRITNRRLDYFYEHEDRLPVELRKDVGRARDIIRDTLGDISGFYEQLPHEVKITAGATSTRSRRESLPHLKARVKDVPILSSAINLHVALMTSFGFRRYSYKLVDENRIEAVPKNWKTHRTIACEPEGAMPFQLALDGFIKRRLLRIGVNLWDQSLNQESARKASITDETVTIDLSMASDTLAYNTVAWLLPWKWFEFACRVRTPFGRGFGRRYEYAKFSSMGNGATFTLESLIFAALCKSVGAESYNVYGDDLIVPRDVYPRLLTLLRFFGFQVNMEKSYTHGPFRESCGTDWFLGTNVTPFYVRWESSTRVEVIHTVNGLASISSPFGHLANYLRDIVVQEKLPLVPFGESSISGVWIHPSDAYALKLIRTNKNRRRGIVEYKAYVPHTTKYLVTDSRTYYLWHFDAQRRLADRKSVV